MSVMTKGRLYNLLMVAEQGLADNDGGYAAIPYVELLQLVYLSLNKQEDIE